MEVSSGPSPQDLERTISDRRLVDYFILAGYDHQSGSPEGVFKGGGDFPCRGKILQRFPQTDWQNVPYHEGLEHFCQPQGWALTTDKSEPKFFIAGLTDIQGQRHYCAVLSFSEAVSKEDLEVVQEAGADEEIEEELDGGGKSLMSIRTRSGSAAGNSSSLPRHMVPGVSLPAMAHDTLLFAPKCLVLTSRYDYPELLRNCLGVIYTAYSECLVGVGGERIRLETLVGNLIGSVYVPPPDGPQVRFSLGATDKMTLQPSKFSSLPSTGTKVALLFQQLGIRNVLTLLCATITELKILFYSRSFNRLTDACTALVSLIYPMKYSHVFIPILPSSLIEVLATPTPFIIGINSVHENEICDLLDVVKVDLDGGAITIPENMTIHTLPERIQVKVQNELCAVLNPELALADNAFHSVGPGGVHGGSGRKPQISLDKELRAVILRLMVQLLQGYRSCLTLVRIHPAPYITFHKAAFLGLREMCDSPFMRRLLECMFFNTFISERGLPWRNCDIFDELYSNFGEQHLIEREEPTKTLVHIKILAEEIFRCENPLTTHNQPYAQKIPQPAEGAMSRVHQPVFPVLEGELVEDLIRKGIERYKIELVSSPSVPTSQKLVPMGQQITGHGNHTMLPNSTRRLNVLRNCIASIFENKISDAKKTFPAVISALKNKTARMALCEELAAHKTGNLVLLEHSQFDMVVRLMNAALQDDSDMDEHGVAFAMLPLSTTFGRKLSAGVIQRVYTLIQDHAVWQNIQFWEAAFFSDVQKEIKNLYLNQEDQNSNPVVDSPGAYSARDQRTSVSSATELSVERHVGNRAREARKSTIISPVERSVLEIAANQMRGSSDVTKGQQEEQTIFSIACSYIDNMIFLTCPLDTPGNQGRGGRRVRDEFENHSNSISNSMAESDSIDAESGFEDQEIPDGGQTIIKNVQRFIDKVCAESNINEALNKSLNNLIPNNVALHLDDLEKVSTQAKRLPPIQKPKILSPSLLPGEELVVKVGLRVYLLADGRGDTTGRDLGFLPAEGALFLTNYRLIFKGSPIDPFAAENNITRFFPVTSLTREKRFTVNEYLSEIDQQLREGMQLRSSSFQLIKVGFDEEVTMEDVENFRKAIQRVQYPEDIFNFFAFRGIHGLVPDGVGKGKEKNPKYSTIRGFASKTLKNVTRATGMQQKKRKPSKYLIPNVMPTQGRLSLPEINQDNGQIREEDEDIPSHLLPSNSNTMSATKTVDRLMERCYFKDWIRIGLISPEYNLAAKGHHYSETFRVTSVNNKYGVVNSYPALLLVPARITDDSIRRYSRCHRQNRFPVITWKHPVNHSLLLRGAGYHHKGVMNKLRRHQDGPASGQSEFAASQYETELYTSAVIQATPRTAQRPDLGWNMSGSELSINSLVAAGGAAGVAPDYGAVHTFPTLTPNMARKYNPITKAMGAMSNTLTRGTAPPKFGRTSLSSLKGNRAMGSQSSLTSGIGGSSSYRSSYRSTGGGDNTDGASGGAKDVGTLLQQASLYIFVDKSQAKGGKLDSHPKTEFIPVEYPEPRRLRTAFKKLMRACVPSSEPSAEDSFLKQVEESEWLPFIQTIMQIAGAVVDLVDIQGASVMVSLEEGWDITAQVTSVAKILLDPYYRTMEGFRVLLETEWLAYGHRFNHRSNLSNLNQDSGFTPVFLQFLDIVHQIHCQFPLAFEFNLVYLQFLAYHHLSCRFRTFLLDSEQQRHAIGFLAAEDKSGSIPSSYSRQFRSNVSDSHSSDEDVTYHPGSNSSATLPAGKANGGNYGTPASNIGFNVFDYIEIQAAHSSVFYNFLYSPELSGQVLRPFSHISDLRIWQYYVEEELRHGSPYDFELYTMDVQQENIYNASDSLTSSSIGANTGRETVIAGFDCLSKITQDDCSQILAEIKQLESQLGLLSSRWRNHWNRLDVPPPLVPREDRWSAPLIQTTPSTAARHHGRLMHKRSTMELILKGKIGHNASSSSVQNAANPGDSFGHSHRFEKYNFSTPTYCEVCNSLLWGPVKAGLRCADCGYSCHEKCRENVPKACTKYKSVPRDSTTENIEQLTRDFEAGAASRGLRGGGGADTPEDLYSQFEYGRQSVSDENSQIICQGYLHKQANFRIKGWKQRWFVLDATKHQLRYYDTREDFQCKGHIDLAEVTRISESKSQPGAPRKEDELYFDLHTVKRTYCFCAETRQATLEWINKIRSCISS